MKLASRRVAVLGFVLSLSIPAPALATNGYFQIGYGAKSTGMAGIGAAYHQDALAASVNPAGMAWVGERADLGVRWFRPIRESELDIRPFGGTQVQEESRRNDFGIPDFGYNRQINSQLWAGVSVYGNGGMNSTYDRNIYDQAFAQLLGLPGPGTGTPNTGTLGVDLMQLIIAPTLSYKLNQDHAVGASLLIGAQRFSARGLGNFCGFTRTGSCATSPNLTNNGNDWSYGAGIRVGWSGRVHPRVTLGAAVTSKMYMGEFDDYSDLFAEDGDFDIPASLTLGIAVQATPKVTVAFDVQRIFYGDVDSIANPGPVASDFAAPSRPLGSDNGFGFGWEDIWVYRLGINYDHNSQWTFRAGLDISESAIPDDELLFNILAPAVVKQHLTLGFTYRPDPASELNFAYMHAFEEEQEGITGFGGAAVPARLQMYQHAVNVSYSWKF